MRSASTLRRAAAVALTVVSWAPLPAAAQPASGATIPVTAEQQQALGIALADVEAGAQGPGALRPAEVVIPNGQLRVVSARVPGVVESLAVAAGDAVAAGAPLATLRSGALVERASAFLQADARHALARSTAAREEQLAAEGIVARRRAQAARAELAESAAALREHRHALLIAGLSEEEVDALARSHEPPDTVVVRAPIGGVVLEQGVAVGERVEADQLLYRIGSLRPLWIEIHVPLEVADALAEGAPVEVPEAGVRGRVTAIGREVHPVDQGVLVRAEVDEGADALRPGQFVQARIADESGDAAGHRVPRGAVARSGSRTVVFVAVPGGFEVREVRVLADDGERVRVAGALRAGERVTASGTSALKSVWLAEAGGD